MDRLETETNAMARLEADAGKGPQPRRLTDRLLEPLPEADLASRVAEERQATYRRRLTTSMAGAIVDNGYNATTIAEIVERAGMSKRGFYEVFSSKEACFLALYHVATDLTIAAIEHAMRQAPTVQEKIAAGVQAFLAVLSAQPALTRAHFVDIHGLGEPGLAARRQALDRYGERTWAALWSQTTDTQPPPVPYTAMLATLGAINELTLRAVETGGTERLRDRAPEIVGIVQLVHSASDLLRRETEKGPDDHDPAPESFRAT